MPSFPFLYLCSVVVKLSVEAVIALVGSVSSPIVDNPGIRMKWSLVNTWKRGQQRHPEVRRSGRKVTSKKIYISKFFFCFTWEVTGFHYQLFRILFIFGRYLKQQFQRKPFLNVENWKKEPDSLYFWKWQMIITLTSPSILLFLFNAFFWFSMNKWISSCPIKFLKNKKLWSVLKETVNLFWVFQFPDGFFFEIFSFQYDKKISTNFFTIQKVIKIERISEKFLMFCFKFFVKFFILEEFNFIQVCIPFPRFLATTYGATKQKNSEFLEKWFIMMFSIYYSSRRLL